MRLATWNCRQRVDAKRHAFDLLDAAVVVVPECSADPELSRALGVSFLWQGEYVRKGLGIVSFGGWNVEPLDAPVDLPWALPVRVTDPAGAHAFDLLGVWTVKREDGRPGYPGQIARLLEVWAPILSAGNTIVAGDFNCSLQGPSKRAHASNVARFAELGLHSAYHAFSTRAHGAEAAMTLQWVAPGRLRQGYHCDYVFVPARLLREVTAVTVGTVDLWVDSGLSDHSLVAVDFGLSRGARR